jgi:phosphotransacetylase
MRQPNYFGAMMVHMGDADGYVSGLGYNYTDSIRPTLQIIKMREGLATLSSLYLAFFGEKTYFLADSTINIDPSPVQLAEIAVNTAAAAEFFNVEPRVAMVSSQISGGTSIPPRKRCERPSGSQRRCDRTWSLTARCRRTWRLYRS